MYFSKQLVHSVSTNGNQKIDQSITLSINNRIVFEKIICSNVIISTALHLKEVF
jgi:hypothetical protein